jgi:hypothetical protein
MTDCIGSPMTDEMWTAREAEPEEDGVDDSKNDSNKMSALGLTNGGRCSTTLTRR